MFRLSTIVFLSLIAAPTLAETPSYNYIDIAYVKQDIDLGSGFDVNGYGYGVGGAFEIGNNFFGFAEYADVDFDFNIEITALAIGIGYHTDLTDTTSFYTGVAYAEGEGDAQGVGSVDESGYGVSLGVRTKAAVDLELGLGIAYVDLGDGADGTTIGGSFLYDITDSVALGFGVDFGDDEEETYTAGVRINFGD